MFKGDLVVPSDRFRAAGNFCVAEVVSKFSKPFIDPECPESVEIATMVRIKILSGESIGKERTMRYSSFIRGWKKVEEQGEQNECG